MAWTAPRSWVALEVVTAALMNTHIRDNLLETSAATASVAGDFVYADAANSMGSRLAIGAAAGVLGSTGSAPVWRYGATDTDTGTGSSTTTSYLTLSEAAEWNFGSAVAAAATTGTRALVLWKSWLSNSTAGALTYMSYSVSGATTTASNDIRSIYYESSNANDGAHFGGFDFVTGLTAGANTFTLEARASAGTGTVTRPEIAVIPF